MFEHLLQAAAGAYPAPPGTTAAPLKFQDARGRADLACNVFSFARSLGLDPAVAAARMAEEIAKDPMVESATTAGAYINIRLDAPILFDAAIATYQALPPIKPERIMVEYLSPNTNKPLHLGHVRNGVLGVALANLLEAVGHDVIRANLVNDRGVHICKSMLAYQRFGNGETPASTGKKGDHLVGDYYVKYSNEEKADPSIARETEAMLRAWEEGDEATVALWKTMNAWVYEGFAATYDTYGFRFDTFYYESDLYRLGKDIVDEGIARGVFQRLKDGSIVYPLDTATYGTNPDGGQRIAGVMRADGTSLYLTQDLGTAVRKAEQYALDRSIYVVMSEQTLHFKSLFDILKTLGYPWADRCYHFSYEMVELPEGRMKSREGTVVDADDLAALMAGVAEETIIARHGASLSRHESKRRASVIGLAAIKFYLLRYNPNKKVVFDPKASLSFEGDTGPYCLYTYARARSIIRKAQAAGHAVDASEPFARLGSDEERALARSIIAMPATVTMAADTYNPSVLADHVLLLARAFNRFYKSHPVLTDDVELVRERLALTNATCDSLAWGLSLLGIETLEEM